MEKATYAADNTELDDSLDDDANRFALRTILATFADRSSIVGPPFIISSKNWIVRSIWILLFLGAVGFTCWQVWSNTTTYFGWPIKTEVKLDYSTLSFPMVTICNTNPIRRSQLHLTSPNLNEFLQALNPDDYERNETMTPPPVRRRKRRRRRKRFIDSEQMEGSFNKSFMPEDMGDFEEELGGKEHPQNKILKEFKYLYGAEKPENKVLMGHQLDDMLLSCSFETRECDSENFTRYSSNKFGNCFAFNFDNSVKSKRWGNENGLSVVLYLEVDEYIQGLTLGYGIRVSITDPGKMPFPSVDGLFISAGRESDVGVRMVNVTRLGVPYGNCADNDAYRSMYDADYSRQLCQATCVSRTIYKNCSCYEHSQLYLYPKDTEEKLVECSTDAHFKCVNEIERANLRGTLNCSCLSPCNETTYDTQITSREWPTQEYLNALVDAVCREELEDGGVVGCNRLIEDDERHKRRNFVMMNIFYRDLNFEVMTETADYPIDKYLSDLGGSIGLGLGLCILSLFELLHLLSEIILYFVYKVGNAGKLKDKKRRKPRSAIHPDGSVLPVTVNGT